MKGTIIGHTVEDNKVDMSNIREFSGKNAGICYMKDSYFNSAVTDKEKALKRCDRTIKSGHNSVTEHYSVTLLLEGMSKIVVMILNSLGVYSTSEKSGRYTEIKGTTELEVDLYNKWYKIIKEQIHKKYKQVSEEQASKLALENARYMSSVFAEVTTLAYTTNIAQWNYIRQWCLEFNGNSAFEIRLKEQLMKLAKVIEENGLVMENLVDTKNRDFSFIKNGFTKHEPLEQFGIAYTLNYKNSFVGLAQAIRHRTLDYFMRFNGESTEFFVPYILDSDLKEEWLADIKSIAHVFPNGTLVGVTETGNVMNFCMKCKERLCGRAQLEIAKQTDENLKRIYLNTNDENVRSMLKDYLVIENGIIVRSKTKCQLAHGCKDGCTLGADKAIDRCI